MFIVEEKRGRFIGELHARMKIPEDTVDRVLIEP